MIIFLKEVIYIKVDRKEQYRDFKLHGEPLNNKSKFLIDNYLNLYIYILTYIFIININ